MLIYGKLFNTKQGNLQLLGELLMEIFQKSIPNKC